MTSMESEKSRASKNIFNWKLAKHLYYLHRKAGSFISEPAVLVRHKSTAGSQIWSIDKLESKLIDMREVYEEVRSKNLDFSAVGRTIPDPFFETKEQHNLIGVANVFLDVLFHRKMSSKILSS